MNLKEYLKKKEMSAREYAKRIGLTNATISNIVKGKRPYKKNALLIEKDTYKEVTAQELLSQEKWKNINKFK